jgi:ferredoxin-like protein FixX
MTRQNYTMVFVLSGQHFGRTLAIQNITAIKEMSVNRYNNLHKESRLFLKESIENSTINNEKTIVITHHVPLHELTHEKYKIGLIARYNQCFSADLSDVISQQNTIYSWFYGHTHTKTERTFFNIPFHCNPHGYDGENDVIDINVYTPICHRKHVL